MIASEKSVLSLTVISVIFLYVETILVELHITIASE